TAPFAQSLEQITVQIRRAGGAPAELALGTGQQRRPTHPAGHHPVTPSVDFPTLADQRPRISRPVELWQEPAGATRLAARRARRRVGEPEPLAGPGDPDVQQPALLLDLLGGPGVRGRQRPV